MAKYCVFLELYHYTGELKTITSFHVISEKAFLFKVRELVEISSSFNGETKWKETQVF